MPELFEIYAQPKPGDERRRLAYEPRDPGFQHLSPDTLFDSRALFSQIVVAPVGRTVWISGLVGCDRENRLVGGGKHAQIARAFVNLGAAMAAASLKPDQVVRITEYIVDYDQDDLPALVAGIAGLFPEGRRPANVLVPVPRLGRDGAWFEIDAHGVLPG